jgi:hypothetical protein
LWAKRSSNGTINGAVESCTPDKVIKGGNTPIGYQNFVMVMGVANATKPYAEGRDAGFPAIPFSSLGCLQSLKVSPC